MGHYSVKVAVVAQNRLDVLDLVEEPVFPHRSFLDEVASEEHTAQAVSRVLTSWTKRARHHCTVTLAAQGDGPMGQLIDLPALEKKQVEMALEAACVRLLPFPRAEAAMSHVPVAPPRGALPGATSHFVVALRQGAIESLGRLMQRCDLTVEKAELHVLPLVRAFIANHPRPSDGVEGLVHVGSRMTTVLALQGPHPLFMRCFRLGGADFTYGLQMGLQGTWQEAQQARFASDAMDRGVAVEPALRRWLEQVRKSVDAVRLAREEAARPTKLWLSGGTARWRGLDGRLEEHLGIPVQVDDWERLKPPQGREGFPPSSFNIALGLCLA